MAFICLSFKYYYQEKLLRKCICCIHTHMISRNIILQLRLTSKVMLMYCEALVKLRNIVTKRYYEQIVIYEETPILQLCFITVVDYASFVVYLLILPHWFEYAPDNKQFLEQIIFFNIIMCIIVSQIGGVLQFYEFHQVLLSICIICRPQ